MARKQKAQQETFTNLFSQANNPTEAISQNAVNPKAMINPMSSYASLPLNQPMYQGSGKTVGDILTDYSRSPGESPTRTEFGSNFPTFAGGSTRQDSFNDTNFTTAVRPSIKLRPQPSKPDVGISPVKLRGSKAHTGGHARGTLEALHFLREHTGNNKEVINSIVNK